MPDGLKEAIEGAFGATERTRAQAQGFTDDTRKLVQGLVDELAKRGSDARGTLDGLRLVSRDELRGLHEKIDALSSRVAELEAESKARPEG